MNGRMKRFLAILLTAIMLISSLPMDVVAEALDNPTTVTTKQGEINEPGNGNELQTKEPGKEDGESGDGEGDPTEKPADPTEKPADPTEKPADPTEKPADPTEKPADPTEEPTAAPTEEPTAAPTEEPEPTVEPTEEPEPTAEPTEEPEPTAEPTEEPEPTAEPTEEPEPTAEPTEEPEPTAEPTEEPEPTAEPTEEPEPTAEPTEEPEPTAEPTEEPEPTVEPTEEPEPTAEPTEEPEPTVEPTEEPEPTAEPTEEPEPTVEPTEEPAVEVEPIELKVTAQQRYGVVDQQAVSFKVSLSGGAEPLTVINTITVEGEVVYTAEGYAETVTYLPVNKEAGTLTLTVSVSDALGNEVQAEASTPVSIIDRGQHLSWLEAVPAVDNTKTFAERLLAVASSQVGYRESEKTFIIDESGKVRYYTIYGELYGSPYSEWCAYFVDFCLDKAEIPEDAIPRDASCSSWIGRLGGRYVEANTGYTPNAGDLVFFSDPAEAYMPGLASHVGIVASVSEGGITVIEGNSNYRVKKNEYYHKDYYQSRIIGYMDMTAVMEKYDPNYVASVEPTEEPIVEPTVEPTEEPIVEPTVEPTEEPIVEPTVEPTEEPIVEPTVEPTEEPVVEPTVEPTEEPIVEPTIEPTEEPVVVPEPNDIVVDYTDAATGVKVAIPYKALPEGVAAEDVTITVAPLSGAALEELAALLGEDEEAIVAYDITLYANGATFEPIDDVSVVFPLPEDTTAEDELNVYHVDANNEVDPVDATFTDSACEFSAGAFSTYVVTRGGNRGNGPTYPDNATLAEKLEIFAEYYYGENAVDPKDTILIFNASNPTNNVHAGDTLTFDIDYQAIIGIPYSGTGFDNNPNLFNTYDNVRIIVHMPPGLTASFNTGSYAGQFTSTTRPDGGIDYAYPLDPTNNPISIGPGTHGFDISVYVQGNGTDQAIRSFNLADYIEIIYDINVDLYADDASTVIGKWTRSDVHKTASGSNFTTVPADGEWGVYKEATAHSISGQNVGSTVTLTWEIDVGLVELDNEGNVIGVKGNNTDYSQVSGAPRTGVVPLDTVTLYDSFTSYYIKVDGSKVDVSPTSVKIKKQGSNTEVDITEKVLSTTPQAIDLSYDANNSLSINKGISVDKTGNGTADQPIDTVTKYTVTATYTVTEAMIADFSENGNYTLYGENSANTEITYVGIDNRTDEYDIGPIVNSETLPKTKPAILTITKMLTDYHGDVKNYYDDYDELPYGPIDYTLEAKDGTTGFKVYSYTEQNGYQSDTSLATSHTLGAGTYYLTSGIEYELSEEMDDFVTEGVMIQTKFNDNTYTLVKTPDQDETWSATFNNRETKGFITINKTNDKGQELNGAVFTLTRYTDSACTTVAPNTTENPNPIELSIDANGTVTSGALPYGWYKLVESTVPTNHSKLPNAEETITPVSGTATTGTYTWDTPFQINDDNHSLEFNAVNKRLNAKLSLDIYVGVSEETITNKATDKYEAQIVLKRKIEGGTWETVTSAKDDNGTTIDISNYDAEDWQTAVTLPAYDDNSNVYTYQFIETIPENYYDPEQVYHGIDDNGTNDGTAQTITKEFKLADLGTDNVYHARTETTTIEIINRKLVRTNLTKNTYKVGSDGQTTSTIAMDWTMYLYSYTDATNHSDLAQVSGTSSKTVNASPDTTNGRNWHYLPLYQKVGDEVKRIYYAVREDIIAPYALDETATADAQNKSTTFKKTISGTSYTFVNLPINTSGSSGMFTAEKLPAMTKLIINRTTLRPIRIWKWDYNTNAPMGGVQIKIEVQNGSSWEDAVVYNADGTLWTDGDTDENAQATNIVTTSANNYVAVYLVSPSSDAHVRFVEVQNSIPTRYHYATADIDNYYNKTSNPDHYAENRVSDWWWTSGQTSANNKQVKYTVVNFYNIKDPEIRIDKVDSTNTSTKLNDKNISFKVYTKDNSGNYVPYPDAANQVVITARGDVNSTTTNPYEIVTLPLGDYYFVEDSTNLPEDYLDPNTTNATIQAMYTALGSDYAYATIDGQTVLVIKGTVTNASRPSDPSTSTPNKCVFTFKNVPNKGSLKVTKKIDGANSNVPGFPIVVTGSYVNKAGETVSVSKTQTTGSLSTDLVYTATISGLPVYDGEGNKITYTVSEGELTGGLASYYYASEPQETTLIAGNTITTVDGATGENAEPLVVENKTPITLDVDKVYQNTWMSTHGGVQMPMGNVKIALYEKVNGVWTYKAEATTDSTGGASFSGIEREGEYAVVEMSSPMPNMYPYMNGVWKQQLGDPAPATLTDLTPYNFITIDGSAENSPLQTLGSNGSYNIGTLVNANHWVQFNIDKYLDGAPEDPNNPGHAIYAQDEDHTQNATLLDDCVFSLYYYVVGVDGPAPVAFDGGQTGTKWHYVNSYTSGTAFTNDGERIKGKFYTDVMMDINENWIFVLVEENVGNNSGVEINPYFKYTVFTEEHKDYTVTVPGGYGAQEHTYVIDTVNEADVYNSPLFGDGGGSDIMITTFRLAKWVDTFNANGQPNALYDPLSNAKFKLYITDAETGNEVEIADMASGKEGNANYALAQSGNFALIPADYSSASGVGTLKDHENEGGTINYKVNYTRAIDTARMANGSTKEVAVYKVAAVLREKYAPDGYGFSGRDYNVYLMFIDESPNDDTEQTFWYFSDAYFIKDKEWNYAEGSTTERVPYPEANRTPLAEDQPSTPAYYASKGLAADSNYIVGSDRYRIVDYPMTNTMVTVYKFGYQPTTDTLDLTSKQIYDQFLGDVTVDVRKLVGGVTMKLERKHPDTGAWAEWSPTQNKWGEGTFTIDETGRYKFQEGLPKGEYRITEINLGTHEGAYENAYPDTAHARCFYVGGVGLDIYMANPKLSSVTIKKTDLSGNTAPAGAAFKLTKTPANGAGNGPHTGTITNADEGVTLNNIMTGSYTLTETAAPSGYSMLFFDTLNASVNPIEIGYDYDVVTAAEGQPTDTDVVVHTFLEDTNGTVTVKDPKKGQLKFNKRSGSADGDLLTGAQFNLWYKGFSASSGTISVTPPPANATLTGNNSWWRQNSWTNKTLTNNNNGVFEATNLEPGVYAIYEYTIPSGHGRYTPTDELGVVIYYVVITGGLSVTVTGLPETRIVKTATATTSIDVLFTDSEAELFDIVNPKQVTVAVEKTVTPAFMASENWSVKMILHSSNSKVTTNIVGYATLNKNNTIAVFRTTDTTNNSGPEAKFNIGATLWLEEQVITPADSETSFVIDSVQQTGISGNISAASSGLYKILVNQIVDADITNKTGVIASVCNKWMQGKVTFNKVDAANQTKKLPGAIFKVKIKGTDGNFTDLDESLYTIVDNNGIYTATIKMESEQATYQIYEFEPPEDYLPNPNAKFEVDLDCTDSTTAVVTWEDDLLNSKGTAINVWKFNNRKTAPSGQITFAANGDAEFMLYEYNAETQTWTALRESDDPFVVGEQGTVSADNPSIHALAKPDTWYAIVETNWAHAKYVGPDMAEGAANEDTKAQLPALVSGNAANLPVIEGLGEGLTAYYFQTPLGGEYNINAYNIPYVKLRVFKLDDGLYPENVRPKATFNIYEVPANFVANDTTVKNFLDTNPVPVDGMPLTTSGAGSSSVASGRGTLADWTKADPTKTYLVVETKADFAENGPYNSINKDDNRVVWYALAKNFSLNLPTSTSYNQVVHLINVYGDAKATIEKTVDKSTLDSLLEAPDEGGYKLTYTITPNVTDAKTETGPSKNIALSKFSISESGLTFAPVSSSGPQPSYKFDTITVGQSTQDTQYMDFTITNPTIRAYITYHYSDGRQDTTADSDVTNGSATFTVPAGVSSFDVEYASPEVKSATNQKYTLGYSFTPGIITVNVTVNKLEDGEVGDPVTEITSITNTASASLTYPKWKEDGSGTEDVTPTITPSTVTVNVNPVALPKIQVEKTSVPTSSAMLLGQIVYTIKITNWSTTEEFKNPIVVDMLPTGVVYVDGTAAVSDGAHNESFSITRARNLVGGQNTATNVNDPDGTSETAVVIELEGKLLPNTSTDSGVSDSYVTVTFTAFVKEAAKIYAHEAQNVGLQMTNYVGLTTAEDSYHTVDNENGYAFTDKQGDFPLPMTSTDNNDLLHNTQKGFGGGEAVSREGSLHQVLSSYEGPTFVYVGASQNVALNTEKASQLVKAVQGDQDTGYHEEKEFLGTSSRYLADGVTRGYVRWQLTTMNGQDAPRGGYIVGDIIPKTTDGRQSNWNTEFDHIIQVAQNTNVIASNRYEVYYTTESIDEDTLRADILLAKTGNQPTYWTTDLSSLNKKNIIAFFVKITDSSLTIGPGQTLVISYETTVQKFESDSAFNAIAYTNVNNVFVMTYDNFPMTDGSNQVSATILGGQVKVAGDLWIDEDWDGIQEEGSTIANRRDYSQYTIIQNLLSSFSVGLTDMRTTSDVAEHTPIITTGIENESIRHYQFDGLTPALNNKVPLYVEYSDPTDPEHSTYTESNDPAVAQLRVKALKGTSPATYKLDASFSSSLTDIFKLTNYGNQHYVSDDPNAIAYTDGNAKDSNFKEKGTRASNTFDTREFFIRFSDKIDQSKDIGLRMERDLEILKVAADDPTFAVQGAKFKVYGPFEENQAASGGTLCKFNLVDGVYVYTSDGSGTESTLETDSNGKITISGLNWWKEYVIEEVEPVAEGFDSAMAITATANNTTTVVGALSGNDKAFVLKLPDKAKSQKLDQVKVTNKRSVKVQLNVEKLFNSLSMAEFTFKFDLKLTDSGLSDVLKELNAALINATPSIEELTLTIPARTTNTESEQRVYGSYAEVTLYGAGTYTFTITEQDKTNGEDPNETNTAITYDTEPKNVVVVVSWHDADSQNPAGLYVDSITYTRSDSYNSQTYELIENDYTPEPAVYTPKVKKLTTANSRKLPVEVTVNFEMTADSSNPTGATIAADGTERSIILPADTGASYESDPVDFGEITFTLAGEYKFSFSETGYTPATLMNFNDETNASAEITVTVEDDGHGKLVVTNVTHTGDGEMSSDGKFTFTAEFTNEYLPTPVTYQPKVKKLTTADSRKLPVEVTVNFEMTADSSNPAGATIAANGTERSIILPADTGASYESDPVEFGLITFDTAGEYKFSFSETGYTPATLTNFNDKTNTPAEITVTVESDNEGNLVITNVTHTGEGEMSTDGKFTFTAEFTNEYLPTPVTYQPKVKKLTTANSKKLPVEVTVNFEMTADSSNPAGATIAANGTERSIILPADTGASYESDPVEFGLITFSAAGEYKFSFSETGYTPATLTNFNDKTNTPAEITVTVESDNEGNLVITNVTHTGEGEMSTDGKFTFTAEFTNEYLPTPVTYQPKVKKLTTADSRKLPVEVTVNFEMTADSSNPAGATIAANGTERSIILPADTGASYESDPVEFGLITFSAAGEYKFSFSETGYTPATLTNFNDKTNTPAEITVTVESDNEGNLVITNVTHTGEGEMSTDGKFTFTAEFTNEYLPTPVTYQPKVKKLTTADSRKLPVEVTVNFEMTADSSNPAGATIAANGTERSIILPADTGASYESDPVEFGLITFDTAGEYKFSFSETGYTPATLTNFNDKTNTPAEITVTVESDNEGKLVITNVTHTGEGEMSTDGKFTFTAEFTNEYLPTPVTYQPKVKKLTTANSRKLPVEVTVNFEMTADSSNPAGATIAANGTERSIILPADTGASYESDPVEFGLITFDTAGEYKFSFSETGYTPATLTNFNDKTNTPAEITVKVGSDAQGNLVITEVTYTGEGEMSSDGKFIFTAEFTDEYLPTPVTYQPKVKKLTTANSRKLPVEVTVNFEMTADSSNPAGATIAANGTERSIILPADTGANYESDPVEFGLITFDTAGEYKFSFSETGYTPATLTNFNDKTNTPAEITVTVESDNEGKLVITNVTHTGEGEMSTDGKFTFTAEFTNEYLPTPVTYQPQVKKIMHEDSRPLPVEVTVNFEMTADSNNPAGATIAANGTERSITLPANTGANYKSDPVEFGLITFDTAGEYKFSFSETGYTPTTLANFSDVTNTPAEITVTVESNNEGKLVITNVTHTGEGEMSSDGKFTFTAEFTNKYIPTPTTYQAHVKKLMTDISRPLPVDVTVPFTMAIEKNPNNGATPKDANAMTQEIVLPSATTWATYTYVTKDFSEIDLTWANTYEFSIKEGQWTSTPTLVNDTFVKKPATDATLTIVVEDHNGQLVVVSATATGETTTVGGSAENYTYTAQFTNEYIPKPTEYQPHVKKLMTNISRPLPVEVTVPFTMTITDNPDTGAAIRTAADATKEIVLPSATTWATYNYETKDFSYIDLTWANTYELTFTEDQWTSTPKLVDGTFYKKDAPDAKIEIEVIDNNGQLEVKTVTQTAGETVTIGADNVFTAEFTNEYIPKPTEYQPHVKKLMTNISRPLPVEVTVPFTMTITDNPDTGAAIRTAADATKEIVLPSATTWATYNYETKDFSYIDLTWANTYELTFTEDQWTSTPKLVDGTFYKKDAPDAKIEIEVIDNNGQLEVKTVTQTAGETVTIGADNVFTAEFTNEYIPKPTEYQPHVKKLMTDISRPLPVEVTVPFTMTITDNPDTGAAIRTAADATKEIVLPSATTWATYNYETKDFSYIDLTWANTYELTFTEDQWTSTPKLVDGTFYKKDAPDAKIEIEVIDNNGQLEVKTVTQTAGETVTIGADNVFTAEFTNEYIPKPTEYQPHVKKLMTDISRPLPVDVTIPFTMAITDNPDNGAEARTPADLEQTIVLPKNTPMESYESETKDFSVIDLTWANTYAFSFTEGDYTSDPALSADTFYKKPATDAAIEVEVYDNYGQLEVKSVTVTAGETTETTGTDFTYVAQFTNEYIPDPTDHPINGEKIVTGDETQKDMKFTFTLTPISAVLTDATTTVNVPMPPTDTVTVVGPEKFTFGEAHYEWAGVYTYEINETIGNYVGYTFDGRIWTVTVTVTDNNGKLEAVSEYEADDGSMAELAQFNNIFETSTLTVIKTVVGVPIDTTKSFLFTVRLFDENGDPLYGTYHFTGAVTGDITTGVTSFYLRHGQSVTIYDIPIGATWTVVEHFDPEYFASRISPSGTISRQGSWSRWVNNHEDIPLGLNGVYINVGDCFE